MKTPNVHFITARKVAQGQVGDPFQLNLNNVDTFRLTNDGRTFVTMGDRGFYCQGHLYENNYGKWGFWPPKAKQP